MRPRNAASPRLMLIRMASARSFESKDLIPPVEEQPKLESEMSTTADLPQAAELPAVIAQDLSKLPMSTSKSVPVSPLKRGSTSPLVGASRSPLILSQNHHARSESSAGSNFLGTPKSQAVCAALSHSPRLGPLPASPYETLTLGNHRLTGGSLTIHFCPRHSYQARTSSPFFFSLQHRRSFHLVRKPVREFSRGVPTEGSKHTGLDGEKVGRTPVEGACMDQQIAVLVAISIRLVHPPPSHTRFYAPRSHPSINLLPARSLLISRPLLSPLSHSSSTSPSLAPSFIGSGMVWANHILEILLRQPPLCTAFPHVRSLFTHIQR